MKNKSNGRLIDYVKEKDVENNKLKFYWNKWEGNNEPEFNWTPWEYIEVNGRIY